MNTELAYDATFLENIMREDLTGKRNEYKRQFGEVIKKKRRRISLTQKDLALELGVENTTISRYEKGEIDIPASVLPIICEICKFDFNEYIHSMDEVRVSENLSRAFRHIWSIKGAYPPLEWGKEEYEIEYRKLHKELLEILNSTRYEEVLLYGKMLDIIKYSYIGGDDIKEVSSLIKEKLSKDLEDKRELIDIVVKFTAVKHGLDDFKKNEKEEL